MDYELMRVASVLQRTVLSNTPSKRQKRALALIQKTNCRSLYKLHKMSFTGFTPQQSADVAVKLLNRSAKWFGNVKSKVPSIKTYLEMRFFVRSFLQIADDAGAMDLYRQYAKSINIPSNPTSKQIKDALTKISSTLKALKVLLPANYKSYGPSINKLIKFLDALSRSKYLLEGYSWLSAGERFIKGNLSYCK